MELIDESEVKIKYKHKDQRTTEKELIKRIWNDIDKKGEVDCWLWTGNKTLSGYGRIGHNGKYFRVHRLVYIQTYGEIPNDKPYITHICNNPLCCNPSHLKADTPKGNSQYMVDCDRQTKGEKCKRSNLTMEDIDEIRCLYNTGQYSYEMLAEMFSITKPNIAFIIRNEIWKDNDYKRIYDTKIGRDRKLIYTREQVDKIKEEYSNGSHQRDLAIKYKLSKGTIYNILHDKIKDHYE